MSPVTDLVTKSLSVIRSRSAIEQEFSEVIGKWASGMPVSKYVRWAKDAQQISEKEKLQVAITLDIYPHFAYLFWPIFSNLPETVIADISLSGLLYADYLILLDHIIDGDISGEVAIFSQLNASFLHQRSLALLYHYFPPESVFWREFHQQFKNFNQAILLERDIFQQPAPQYSYDKFAAISCGKSAMAKCAFSALAVLNQSTDKLPVIYQRFDDFSVAAQIHDDIRDWKENLINGKPSYVLFSFLSEKGLQDKSLSEIDMDVLKRQFYLSKAFKDALNDGIQRIDAVMQEPIFTKCEDWLNFLRFFKLRLENITKRVSLIQKRSQAFYSVAPSNPINRGLCYLFESQGVEGEWTDFYTSARESTDWVTGYIGQAVKDISPSHPGLERARNWLLQHRFPEGGWGYNWGSGQDADSTAHCLLFLFDRLSPEEITRAAQSLLLHQTEDGGFGTYASKESIAKVIHATQGQDFSGWCSSQTCVTAASMIALCKCLTRFDSRAMISKAVDYLLVQQELSGAWHSYWWHGYVYGTSLAIKALKTACNHHIVAYDVVKSSIQRGIQYLLSVQLATGGWSIHPEGESCPYQTGLALDSIVTSNDNDDAVNLCYIEQATQYLSNTQKPNGCWCSTSPALRLPDPSQPTPWKQSLWVEKGISLGSLVFDQNHLFTTATVLSALAKARNFHENIETTLPPLT